MTTLNIVIPAYNCKEWIGLNLETLKLQTNQNFKCVVVDDASTDGTASKVKSIIKDDDRFSLIESDKKKGPITGYMTGFDYLNPADEDVVATVDGDDWLSHVFVLEELAEIYQNPQVWMSYGTWFSLSKRYVYPSRAAPDIPDLRQLPHFMTAIRTSKAWLFRKVNREDFIDEETGNNVEVAGDYIAMSSMAEMAGPHHIYWNRNAWMIYNDLNPINSFKIRAETCSRIVESFKKKPSYERINGPES